MAALGIKKRRRPWGTVYDSVTKQPLDPVYVTLKNAEGKEITSSITDLDGRYGFVVPEPGTYTIVAGKTNYLFPSQKLVGQDHDEVYRDLYFGEYFKVANAGDAVFKNIPMDAEHFDWNEEAKRQQSLMRFYSKRDKILGRVSTVLFIFGFAVATLAVIFAPKSYNIAVFALYIVLASSSAEAWRSALAAVRRHRGCRNGASRSHSRSIRISSAKTGVEVMHRIADAHADATTPSCRTGSTRSASTRKLPDGKYETVVKDLPAAVEERRLSWPRSSRSESLGSAFPQKI